MSWWLSSQLYLAANGEVVSDKYPELELVPGEVGSLYLTDDRFQGCPMSTWYASAIDDRRLTPKA